MTGAHSPTRDPGVAWALDAIEHQVVDRGRNRGGLSAWDATLFLPKLLCTRLFECTHADGEWGNTHLKEIRGHQLFCVVEAEDLRQVDFVTLKTRGLYLYLVVAPAEMDEDEGALYRGLRRMPNGLDVADAVEGTRLALRGALA